MYIKINSPKKYKNHRSCLKLVEYLDKENENIPLGQKQAFFNQERNDVPLADVVNGIDSNIKKLGSDETKYYMLSINPSQKELKHICKNITGRDISDISQMTSYELKEYEQALKDYSNEVMDVYAKNFNRGLDRNDIVYYGKVEHFREYKRDSSKLLEERLKHIKLKEADLDNIYYCKTYYADTGTQDISHGLKNGDKAAITQASKEMVAKIPDDAILIPMPSSCGYATYTKDICEEMKKQNPSLSVMDVLKCNEREKLFELKKLGYEANSAYFNFHLSGSIPKGKKVFFVDNVLSTGSTYVHAKEAVPQAKLVVYGINEETSIKKVKLDQAKNLQTTELPKIGDKKPGLQSHVHIVVSRKDITNSIKLSPMANHKNSLNILPDGSLAQIGFDRKKFVEESEKSFDSFFKYNREQSNSFQFNYLMKNEMAKVTKMLSQSVLPEEMRTIGRDVTTAVRLLNALDRVDSNHSIASTLSSKKKVLNQYLVSSDVLKVQGTLLPKEFKNPNPIVENLAVKTELGKLQGQLDDLVKEKTSALVDLNKGIREAYSRKDMGRVKFLGTQKKSTSIPYNEKIVAINSEINSLLQTNSIKPQNNTLIPFNETHQLKLNSISKELLDVSTNLKEIHNKTLFLENHKSLSSIDLQHKINDLKDHQFKAYGIVNRLDNVNDQLATIKSELFSSLKTSKQVFETQAEILSKSSPNYKMNLEKLKAPHNHIKSDLLNKIDLISRAQKDIQFQKSNIIESTRVISSCQRATDPLSAVKAVFSQVPAAGQALSSIKSLSNPYKLGFDIIKKGVTSLIDAGLGI